MLGAAIVGAATLGFSPSGVPSQASATAPRAAHVRLQDKRTAAIAAAAKNPYPIKWGGETYYTLEESRKYRRTVSDHDFWVTHRITDRFFKNAASTLDSGVVRALSTEIQFVSLIATFVVIANCLVSGYDDFSMVHHAAPFPLPLVKDLSLPAMPFTIAMPALSLLLVFRTNTAYFRWNEARTLWGGIVNTCRNIQRQSNVYFAEDEEGQKLRQQLANEVAAFPKALKSFLRGPEDDENFRQEMTDLLGAEYADNIMASKNRQTFVCNSISATVRRANLDPMATARMDEATARLVDYLGACERIFRSPIPLVYTRHTARFLTSFMCLLPFALWGPMKDTWNHWATIPATALIALFLFGIEELGIQIEEPFGILPLEALCNGSIEAVVMDMRQSYLKGHFGGSFDESVADAPSAMVEPVGVVVPATPPAAAPPPAAAAAPAATPEFPPFSFKRKDGK